MGTHELEALLCEISFVNKLCLHFLPAKGLLKWLKKSQQCT